jgi:DNA-binding GntR family transcriptional regulator
MTEGNTVIHRRVLRDEVADYLIDAILSGSFRPGEKIVETRISKELQVSQGAVREAIRDLIAQGFLETEPYKGTRVREFTPGELGDYYAVRIALEKRAVKWARERQASGELDLTELRDIAARMHQCADSGDTKNLRKLDIDFHKALVRASGNAFLLRAWESLGNYYWACLGIHYGAKGIHPERQASLHDDLIAVLESQDMAAVGSAIEEHFADIRKLFGQ